MRGHQSPAETRAPGSPSSSPGPRGAPGAPLEHTTAARLQATEPSGAAESRPARSHLGQPRRSITKRLLVLHALVVSVVLAVALVEVVRDFSTHYQRSVASDLAEEVPEYARAAAVRPGGQSLEAFTRSYLAVHPLPSGHVLVVGLLGHPTLGSSGSAPLVRLPAVAAWLARPPEQTRLTTVVVGGRSMLVLASPITRGRRMVGVLVAAAGLQRLAAERDRVLVLAGAEAALAVLVAMASAYLLVRRLLRTVGAVTDAAVAASEGSLDKRLDEQDDHDEVGRLAATFNHMLDRISAAMESQRRLLSDVSHQLRTPLTVARGHLEILRRSAAFDSTEVSETTDVVLEELDRMGSLVGRLLLLGRALEPDFLEVGRVDLRAFLGDIFEPARVLADRTWSLPEVPDAVLLVDEAKLRGALLNLIDNAVKATERGDLISLRARSGHGAVLTVADSGRGIPPEAQARVFERFGRAGAPGDHGVGLGLAIVKAVAEAHGGHVELRSSAGMGTEVSVVLPPSCLEGPEREA